MLSKKRQILAPMIPATLNEGAREYEFADIDQLFWNDLMRPLQVCLPSPVPSSVTSLCYILASHSIISNFQLWFIFVKFLQGLPYKLLC